MHLVLRLRGGGGLEIKAKHALSGKELSYLTRNESMLQMTIEECQEELAKNVN